MRRRTSGLPRPSFNAFETVDGRTPAACATSRIVTRGAGCRRDAVRPLPEPSGCTYALPLAGLPAAAGDSLPVESRGVTRDPAEILIFPYGWDGGRQDPAVGRPRAVPPSVRYPPMWSVLVLVYRPG